MRRMESPNITLNLLCGADGITYANTVDGASNMFTFLNFFEEASHVVQENGRPALDYEDHIIMDNTMMTSGSFVLAGWFNHDIPGLAGRYLILPAKPGRFLISP
jgi:hypothetical protein